MNIRQVLITAMAAALAACMFSNYAGATSPKPKHQATKAEQKASEDVNSSKKTKQQDKVKLNTKKKGAGKEEGPPKAKLKEESDAAVSFLAPEMIFRPTDHSITINLVPAQSMELYIEYGTEPGMYTASSDLIAVESQTPAEILLDQLQPDTHYYYRIRYRHALEADYMAGQEHAFNTQRSSGSSFTFAVQGDSHPERPQQHDPQLYIQNMDNALAYHPDFYITIGDDFSIDKVNPITKDSVKQVYMNQRVLLSHMGADAPVFLVNGNHEQAAKYLLNGTPDSAAVVGQNARNSLFSQPAPDGFYTGDTEQVDYIGYLQDYYAWTWGDALFVTIDPYWHSSVPVDNTLGGGSKRSDMWDITLGEQQYQWLKKTLEESNATYKFVFTHHILGTGRGGIERAHDYEWGGIGRNGKQQFAEHRPGWEMPIHELMSKNGVTIFFQGHDHLFAKQELDGVIYQTLPEPADPNYTLYNDDAYTSDAKFANSGHVSIRVSPEQVQVSYIRSLLPKDETDELHNGDVIYAYTVNSK